MRKLVLFILCICFFSPDSLYAKSVTKGEMWHIMSGYGYSGVVGEMNGEGYSNVNTFLWLPKTSWGFGIDYGMNFHNPVKFSPQSSMVLQHTRRHNNFFVGPSFYWFPINSSRHRIHIGGSVNYFYTNDYNRYRHFDSLTQDYIKNKEYYDENIINGVGLGASIGYAYKIGDHIELGARFYTSWSQEETHLMGLINLGFSF